MTEEQNLEVTMPEIDLGEAERQRPPSIGWHKAVLKDVKLTYSKDDMDLPVKSRHKNFVLTMSLAPDSEMPNCGVGSLYVPIPSDDEAEFHLKHRDKLKTDGARLQAEYPDMFCKDGRTKYAQRMDWIKKAATAFGGKETGKLGKNFFVKLIGSTIMVDVEHQEWQGEVIARVKFMGIKPA